MTKVFMSFRKCLYQMYKKQRWDRSGWQGVGLRMEMKRGMGREAQGVGTSAMIFTGRYEGVFPINKFSGLEQVWLQAGKRQRAVPEGERGSPGDPRSLPGEGSGAGSAPPCPAGMLSPAAGSQQGSFCAIERGKAGVPLWKNHTIRPTVYWKELSGPDLNHVSNRANTGHWPFLVETRKSQNHLCALLAFSSAGTSLYFAISKHQSCI